jgi:hypothetical protein
LLAQFSQLQLSQSAWIIPGLSIELSTLKATNQMKNAKGWNLREKNSKTFDFKHFYFVSRRDNFLVNLQKIREHNTEASQGLHTYTQGLNQFSDSSPEEYKKLLGARLPANIKAPAIKSEIVSAVSLPSFVGMTKK